jgi:peptide-methionine (S)-S-oxide reductase
MFARREDRKIYPAAYNLHMEYATFAGGCFWGIQAAFQQVPGVTDTRAGYTGGDMPDPSYQDVCNNQTGHAEAVFIEFDPEKVSYRQLLDVFFSLHDPTEYNRQGPDVGPQYRSAIFYHNEEQKQTAKKVIEELQRSGRYQKEIVTELVSSTQFWPAEEYHQSYMVKMGRRYGGLL